MINKKSKIFLSGHTGMVGSAILRLLKSDGYENLILKNSSELDLRNQKEVNNFFFEEKPEIVINAAARVGGILANNDFPYQFLMDNLQIQNNLIDGAFKSKVNKFIFLGSSCIYPKFSPQPIKEEYLLSDFLEPTNEFYALAKISGVKACEALRKQFGLDYICLMPTNLYGVNDNFDPYTSHVLPAMIRKFHEAKINNKNKVTLWGTGNPKREFLYADDLADAVFFVLNNRMTDYIYNVGTGQDISIFDLALKIKEIVGYNGEIYWDDSKPDGTPRKLLDVTKMSNMGWNFSVNLDDGIYKTYSWFLKNVKIK